MLLIIVKNEKPSFWNLGSNFLDFWRFFKQLSDIPVSNLPAFYEHNLERPTPYETYMAIRRLRPQGVPFQASRIRKGCDFTSWALYEKLGKSVISVCSKKAQ